MTKTLEIGSIVILNSDASKETQDRTFLTVENIWENGKVAVIYFDKKGQIKRDEFLKSCLELVE